MLRTCYSYATLCSQLCFRRVITAWLVLSAFVMAVGGSWTSALMTCAGVSAFSCKCRLNKKKTTEIEKVYIHP